MSKGKEQKPVILQVLPELDHGGVEVGTVQIADALRQHGIKNFPHRLSSPFLSISERKDE